MIGVLVTHIHPESDGSWRITCGEPHLRPEEGVLSPGAVARLLTELEAPPPVARFGSSAPTRVAHWEETLGRALGAVWECTPALVGVVTRATERSRVAGLPLALLLDLRTPLVRELPWEVVALPGQRPLEAHGLGHVIRLGPGQSASRYGSGWRARVQRAEGNEGDLKRIGEALEALARRIGPSGNETVMHWVGHGEQGDVGPTTVQGERHRSATLLAEHVGDARVVALWMCDGASGGQDLPERILGAGADLCLASVGRIDQDTATRFASALHEELAAGSPPISAALFARQAVRQEDDPRPHARWHRIRMVIGDVESARPVPRLRLPPGWPRPAASLEGLLFRTWELATAEGSGFVGVEHLLLALARGPQVEGAELRRHQALSAGHSLREHLAGLVPSTGEHPLRVTPRVRRVMALLEDGYDIRDLLARLLDDQPALAVRLFGAHVPIPHPDEDATLGVFVPTAEGEAVPRGLEVLGGPEDGLHIVPEPLDIIGRANADPATTHGLYADTALVDRSLPRKALRWLGNGLIARPWDGPAQPVHVGELIQLTRSTMLVVTDGTPRPPSGA